MSTLLQTLGFFSDIFDFFLPFLLVFAVTYAILLKTKFLTEDPNINASISFAIALIVALSGAGKFIMNLAPFMATLFIIIFFMLMIFLFFGVKLEQVMEQRFLIGIIIIVCLIFIFYVIGTMYGGSFYSAGASGRGETVTLENGTNVTVATKTKVILGPETCDFTGITGPNAVACLLTHPKVLGTVVLLGLLAIATFFVIYVPKK